MRPILTLAIITLLCAPAARAYDDCDFSQALDASLDTQGVRLIRIDASAGSLKVQGQPGATTVEVQGLACAFDRDDLEDIELITERRSDEIVIEVVMGDSSRHGQSGRLDLEITLPSGIQVDIDDGSGDVEVRGVLGGRLEDGSGDILLSDIEADFEIEDGSGEITVDRVQGTVTIEDGSGDIQIKEAHSVRVGSDGSGDIEATKIDGDFEVREDGSGSIYASDIGGDFVVHTDGSGDIEYEAVQGEVRIPRD